jgi:hypothetical protein
MVHILDWIDKACLLLNFLQLVSEYLPELDILYSHDFCDSCLRQSKFEVGFNLLPFWRALL